MAPTKTVLSCRAVQLVRFTDCKQSPLSPLNAVLHMHQNESLSFDECLKDTHNYPEMRVFIILWSLKPNAKRQVSSKEPLVLFAIMLHYGWLHMSPSVRKSSATCGLFFFFFSGGKAASLHPPPPPPAMKHQSTATLKLQAHFGIALLPLDPVITAHTRHQHYYSSNHSIIIPQNTSKRQLTFQGENKNSWIMH